MQGFAAIWNDGIGCQERETVPVFFDVDFTIPEIMESKMSAFIDVHCHILPGVDDGAPDLETTRCMLRKAWDDGIRCIIATPHYREGFAETDIWKIFEKYKVTAREARQIDPSFQVVLGNELFYRSDLTELLQQKKAFTMALSKYVLVEFFPYVSYRDLGNALRELQYGGFWPILAHVERYDCILSEPERVEELIDMGVYIQVNAMSVTGENGGRTKRFVHRLLKEAQVHLIGTDAHSMRTRKPAMKKCMQIISKKYGTDYADALGRENALCVIKNQKINE